MDMQERMERDYIRYINICSDSRASTSWPANVLPNWGVYYPQPYIEYDITLRYNKPRCYSVQLEYFIFLCSRQASLPSSCHAKSKQYFGPNGHTASISYGIWTKQSSAMVFLLNLDKVSLKKLFPMMNI